MSAVALANGGDQSKRRELDFYPTPPEVTHALMQFIDEKGISAGTDDNAPYLEDWNVWEPACGDGAMSKVLTQYVGHTYSTDIRETGFGIGGVDFLKDSPHGVDAIITNPPFNLSEEFIRHAVSGAPIVAMLLKSQYWHAAKRIGLFQKFPPAYVLPLTWRPDFLFDKREKGGKSAAPTMEVAWSLWVKGDTDTKYRILRKDRAPHHHPKDIVNYEQPNSDLF